MYSFLKKEILDCAQENLISNNYHLEGTFELVRKMPWSTVARILTSQGYVYLKKMAPSFSRESQLIDYLSSQNLECLPKIIAINKSLKYFVMADAGEVLRKILKKDYQTTLVFKVLHSYARIQRNSQALIPKFLSMGLLDWRVANLPSLYQNLIKNGNLLLKEGLTLSEVDQLERLYPNFLEICKLLSKHKIPETIEHCDFQDNNILLKNHYITINDWGDAVISHPFFSIISFLESAERHHGFSKTHHNYEVIRDSYLNNWLQCEPYEELLKCFKLVERLAPIKFSLSFYRVVSNLTEETSVEFQKTTLFDRYRVTMIESIQEFIKSEKESF